MKKNVWNVLKHETKFCFFDRKNLGWDGFALQKFSFFYSASKLAKLNGLHAFKNVISFF